MIFHSAASHSRAANAHLLGRIRVIQGDITAQTDVDAIISSIHSDLNVPGALNGALIKGAGVQLDEFILEHIFTPRAGDVFAVPGFDLPVPNLIFAVLPRWRSNFELSDRDLLQCYRGAMEEAYRLGLKKIAIPLMGTGSRVSFPLRRAARIALRGVIERMNFQIEEVRFVCNRADTYNALQERLAIHKQRTAKA